MTSTSFSTGMNSSKNSSRVIKPPGGGHSDIFGIHDKGESCTPSKKKNVPEPSIKSCFMEEDIPKKNNDTVNGKNGELGNHEMNGKRDINETDESSKPKLDEKVESASLRRQRVPPGGFSSGLW